MYAHFSIINVIHKCFDFAQHDNPNTNNLIFTGLNLSIIETLDSTTDNQLKSKHKKSCSENSEQLLV